MTSRAIVVSLVLAACGATSGSSSRSSPLECDAVISDVFARTRAVFEQVWRDQPPDRSRLLADMLDTVKPVIVESCLDDRWSVELLRCMDRIQVTDDPHKCNHLFTTDQAVGVARRMMAAMQQPLSARDAPDK